VEFSLQSKAEFPRTEGSGLVPLLRGNLVRSTMYHVGYMASQKDSFLKLVINKMASFKKLPCNFVLHIKN